jgi:Na+/melibiose symporter-like transporter
MWRLLIADLGAGFGIGVSGALYIFIATTYFELPRHASIALLFYFLASFLAMPLWLKLAYAVGKDNAMKISLLYMVVINLGLIPLAEAGNVVVLWSFTILYGAAFGAPPTLIRSMMADLTDEDELKTGQQRPGLFFALLTTTNKLGAAFAVGLSFTILDIGFGFVPGASNDETALQGLLFTYVLGTAFGLLAAFFPLLNYPLNRERHAAIRHQLDQREASAH